MFKQTPQKRILFVAAHLIVGAGVFMALLLSTFLALKPNQSVSAATSSTINFQARLLQSNGAIVADGNYHVEFKLYNASSSSGSSQGSCSGDANCLWTETRTTGNLVRVVNGYLTVNLGSVTAFPSINWDQELWLTMNIGGASGSASWDGEMTPRLKLTSTPYAFRAGQLAKLTGANTSILDFATQTGARSILLPDESGTLCIQASTACGFAAASGSGSYIHNGTSVQTANFYVQSAAAGSVGAIIQGHASQTADIFQVKTGGSVDAIKVTSAGNTTFGGTVTVASNKSLILVGGTTANRPSSPSEGEMFFDTDTDQLLTYSNGKWQSDRSTATVIVAANNSPQEMKDGADFVVSSADETAGNADAAINAAIATLPAGGGNVYLAEGTYTIDTSISLPNTTKLAGAGAATIIKFKNGINGLFNGIVNSDTNTGTKVTIQDLAIDGNKANQTSGAFTGIYFDDMGGGSGASARDGGRIANVYIKNMKFTSGSTTGSIRLWSSSNNVIIGNTLVGHDLHGLMLDTSSSYNTITGNLAQGNSQTGFYIYSSSNNTFTGNTAQGNSLHGFFLWLSSNNTLTGNTTVGNQRGFELNSSSNSTITGNTVQGNSVYGIYLGSSSNSNTVGSNTVHDSGGATNNNGIRTSSSDYNTIVGNTVTDTACTSTCYAISISDSTSDKNYLEANRFSGSAANAASINDAGTGTIYAGQQTNTSTSTNSDVSDFRFRGSTDSATAFQLQNASGTGLVTFSSDTSTQVLTVTSTAGGTQKALVVNNSTSTGNILELQDNGTPVVTVADGGAVTITNTLAVGGTDQLQVSNAGDLTFVDADGAATLQGPAGGALNIISGSSQNLVLNKNGGNLVFSGFDCSGSGNGGALTADASGVISCSADDGGAGANATLQDTYNNDANGSDSRIDLTANDDSIIISNPSSSGTDSAFVLKVEQLNTTGPADTLIVSNSGTGNIVNFQDGGSSVFAIADAGVLTS